MAEPVLVAGSVALDAVRTPTEMAVDVLGGAASYCALAAARLAPVRLVAVVGEDFPSGYHDLLRGRGIDLEGLQVTPGKTFRWSGKYYGPRLHQRDTLDTQLNVFADFHPRLPAAYRSSRLVFLGNIQPQLQLEVLQQTTAAEFVACDSMNLWIASERKTLERLFRRVDCVMMSEEEALQFAGEEYVLPAARAVLSYGPRAVIVKRGEYGSLLFGRDGSFASPAVTLEKVRDPTGAGDAFAGGLMGALAQAGATTEQSLRHAMLYGNVLGSLAVEDFGVRRLIDANDGEVERRVAALRAMTSLDGAGPA